MPRPTGGGCDMRLACAEPVSPSRYAAFTVKTYMAMPSSKLTSSA